MADWFRQRLSCRHINDKKENSGSVFNKSSWIETRRPITIYKNGELLLVAECAIRIQNKFKLLEGKMQ